MGICTGEGMQLCVWKENHSNSQCTPRFMLQWSMKQNTEEICLEGSSFTSKLQEWGNNNALPTAEERDGVLLSCEKRWPVHRQGTCSSSQSVWFHYVSIPWNNVSVLHHSLMLRWHQFLAALSNPDTKPMFSLSVHFLWCCWVIYKQQFLKKE